MQRKGNETIYPQQSSNFRWSTDYYNFFKYKALKPSKNEIVLWFSCQRGIFDYDTHYDSMYINVTILPKNKTL